MATTENLILQLRLNQHSEQKRIPDASGNNHTVAMMGDTHLAPDAAFGACLQFDGAGDYLDCGAGFSPGDAPWTVSLWFNPDRLGGENILYNKESLFEGAVINGFFQYAWMPHWNWDGGSSFPVEIGQWYYATVVFDGQKQYMYRNGVKVFERVQTGAIGTNGSKLLLGARGHDQPVSFFAGKLAQFRMYDRVLNPAEIRRDMEADFAGLLLHLPLNEHTEDNRIEDITGNGHEGQMKGQVQLIPDEIFGACLWFDGSIQSVEVPDSEELRLSGDMTLSAWLYLENKASDWVRIVGKGASHHRNYGLWYHPTINHWLFQQGTGGGGFQQVHVTNAGEILSGKWYHLLGVKAGTQGVLYLDGREIGRVDGLGAPLVSTDPLTVGFAGFHAPHSGKIAQVRLYDRALADFEIEQLRLDDQTAMATFHQSHPLEFSLLNDQEQPALFIDEDPAGHRLSLQLENASKQAIQLAASPNTAASAQLHHLALRFRPGTLRMDSLNAIALQDTPGWTMQLVKQSDNAVVIYLWATTAPRWPAGGGATINFAGFRADGAQGSRGTRVELFYQHMSYEGSTTQIRGERLTHLNIVNHEGRQNIPLHVGFLGSNIILNDAVDDNTGTANTLRLRLTNTLKLDPANPAKSNILLRGKNADQATRLAISFDVQNDGELKDWALGTKSQVANIHILPPARILPGGQALAWVPATGKPGDTFELANDVTLPAGAVLEFQISSIKSSLPAGHTNLYLHYENIPGYWEGQFTEVIEKSPLIYRTNAQGFEQVGIGTADPKARLEVNGDVRAKGLRLDGETWLSTGSILYVDWAIPGEAVNWVPKNEKLIEFATKYKGDQFRGQVHLYAPSAYYDNIPVITLAGNYGGGGKVGIGATEPETMLEVKGEGGSSIDFRVNGRMQSNNIDGGLWVSSDRFFGGHSTNKMGLWNGNAWRLTVQSNGNIGINNNDPSYLLDVNGMMRAWRYYDDDTNFYIDANTTSVMNVIHASILYDRSNTRYHLSPGGRSSIQTLFLGENYEVGGNNNVLNVRGNTNENFPLIFAENKNSGWVFYAHSNQGRHYGKNSSIRLKENISKITGALTQLLQIEGVRFKWKESGREDIGFIAEQVGEHLPEAVTFEENGYASGMSYDHLVPLLVEAVKEQQQTIESLEVQIKKLIAKNTND